ALRTSDGTLRWKVRLANGNVSALAVSNGTIYVAVSDSPANQAKPTRRAAAALVALRSSDGAQLWRVSAAEHTLGAPSSVGGVLYGSEGDGLSARLATDGALLWHVGSAAIAPDLLACTCLQPYVSVAPIVAHGQLFATISVAYL